MPEPLIKESGTKIMNLVDPSKKMSKSDENKKGVIELLDSPNDIRKKIMSATTDSDMIVKYDPDTKPGISNLINLYRSFNNKSIKEIEKEFAGQNYGTFKTAVADLVVSEIEKIQNKYYEILESKELNDILDKGLEKTREIAKLKYETMKEKMGLGR